MRQAPSPPSALRQNCIARLYVSACRHRPGIRRLAGQIVQEQHQVGTCDFASRRAGHQFVRPHRSSHAGRPCPPHERVRLRSGSVARPCRAWCPAIGVTMASSAPASALSSELLPTLGCPRNHDLDAFAQYGALAWRAASRPRAWPAAAAVGPAHRLAARKSMSSSGKSSVASTSMRKWISCSSSVLTSSKSRPDIDRAAERAAASVLASIRSQWLRPAPDRFCHSEKPAR